MTSTAPSFPLACRARLPRHQRMSTKKHAEIRFGMKLYSRREFRGTAEYSFPSSTHCRFHDKQTSLKRFRHQLSYRRSIPATGSGDPHARINRGSRFLLEQAAANAARLGCHGPSPATHSGQWTSVLARVGTTPLVGSLTMDYQDNTRSGQNCWSALFSERHFQYQCISHAETLSRHCATVRNTKEAL